MYDTDLTAGFTENSRTCDSCSDKMDSAHTHGVILIDVPKHLIININRLVKGQKRVEIKRIPITLPEVLTIIGMNGDIHNYQIGIIVNHVGEEEAQGGHFYTCANIEGLAEVYQYPHENGLYRMPPSRKTKKPNMPHEEPKMLTAMEFFTAHHTLSENVTMATYFLVSSIPNEDTQPHNGGGKDDTHNNPNNDQDGPNDNNSQHHHGSSENSHPQSSHSGITNKENKTTSNQNTKNKKKKRQTGYSESDESDNDLIYEETISSQSP